MGINLKIARIKKGLNQIELAQISGVSRHQIAALENGRATNPNLDTIKKISKALDVSPLELFFNEDSDIKDN